MFRLKLEIRRGEARAIQDEAALRAYITSRGTSDTRYNVTVLAEGVFEIESNNKKLLEAIHNKVRQIFYVDPVVDVDLIRSRQRVTPRR